MITHATVEEIARGMASHLLLHLGVFLFCVGLIPVSLELYDHLTCERAQAQVLQVAGDKAQIDFLTSGGKPARVWAPLGKLRLDAARAVAGTKLSVRYRQPHPALPPYVSGGIPFAFQGAALLMSLIGLLVLMRRRTWRRNRDMPAVPAISQAMSASGATTASVPRAAVAMRTHATGRARW